MTTMSKKAHILLVEDDKNLSAVLKDYLEILNYSVSSCSDGKSGLMAFSSGTFDLCILDIMMPEKDGFTLASEIRREDPLVPIIFLTAKSLKEDRIKGFKAGCDDYISKPFSTEELSLRIEAILKRCRARDEKNTTGEKFVIGGFVFDHANMVLSYKNENQNLTRKEADLLRVLALNKNRLVTREAALKMVWGTDDYFIGRSMDVFITKLRKYLKKDSSIAIVNVHGIGFRLEC
ncbi:MAG: response regulator transcription factor [Bacteroidales bacterium]|nr:response regulator transcription factor [Bacteroidales bacterium]